jgi:hypothetical protein
MYEEIGMTILGGIWEVTRWNICNLIKELCYLNNHFYNLGDNYRFTNKSRYTKIKAIERKGQNIT